MVWVDRTLKVISFQLPCHAQGHLQQDQAACPRRLLIEPGLVHLNSSLNCYIFEETISLQAYSQELSSQLMLSQPNPAELLSFPTIVAHSVSIIHFTFPDTSLLNTSTSMKNDFSIFYQSMVHENIYPSLYQHSVVDDME